MAVNCAYIKSLVAILKVASIAFLSIAYGTGMHGYLSSEYNKGCMNPTPSPNPTRTPSTISTSSVTPGMTFSHRQNHATSLTSTTEGFIVSLDPQPTFSTTVAPKTGCDKAPILWMERLHLIVTGICLMLSVILLILHLVKADLLENPKFRGVDFGYHFFGAIWLIVSGVFMAYTSTKIDSMAKELCISNPGNCQLMKEKLTAAAFAFLAGILFIAVAMKNFGKKFYQTV